MRSDEISSAVKRWKSGRKGFLKLSQQMFKQLLWVTFQLLSNQMTSERSNTTESIKIFLTRMKSHFLIAAC